MPSVAIVKHHDYGAWRADHAAGRAAGGLGPYGIDALEVWHTLHNQPQTDHYTAQATKFGLLVTGGSDFHGPFVAPNARIGIPRVPARVLDALKERKAERA